MSATTKPTDRAVGWAAKLAMTVLIFSPPLIYASAAWSAPRHDYPSTRAALIDFYRAWQGTPYAWGGVSTRGVDCSGFAQLAYAHVFEADLPRHTRLQARVGLQVSPRNLEPGDLLFFKTGRRVRHVGVYVGGGEFIHASRSAGVTKSSVRARYWLKRLWVATRPMLTPPG